MITLICGRSRAGKTTYSQKYPLAFHLDCGGYGHMIQKVKEANGDVIIEGIYDTPEKRVKLLEAYKGNGEHICIWLDTPLDIIESRFHPTIKPPDLPHSFEPPTYEEGWDKIIIIKGDSEWQKQ